MSLSEQLWITNHTTPWTDANRQYKNKSFKYHENWPVDLKKQILFRNEFQNNKKFLLLHFMCASINSFFLIWFFLCAALWKNQDCLSESAGFWSSLDCAYKNIISFWLQSLFLFVCWWTEQLSSFVHVVADILITQKVAIRNHFIAAKLKQNNVAFYYLWVCEDATIMLWCIKTKIFRVFIAKNAFLIIPNEIAIV